MDKVRVGMKCVYMPCLLDAVDPPYNIKAGDIVRVINKHGCPKANTMGHCYVEHMDGSFAGLVSVRSLELLRPRVDGKPHGNTVRGNGTR